MNLLAGHPSSIMVQLVDSAGNNITSPAQQEDPQLAATCSSYVVPGPNLLVAAGERPAFPDVMVDKGSWCDPAPQVRRKHHGAAGALLGTSRPANTLLLVTLLLLSAGALAWKRALPNPNHAGDSQVSSAI